MKTNGSTSHPLRLGLTLFVAVLFNLSTAYAADPIAILKPAASSKDLALTGDATCTKCHDESDATTVLAIGKTRHGTKADHRTPSCVSCHGESDKHVNKPEGVKDRPKPDVLFNGLSKSEATAQSGSCLSCHAKDAKRSHWAGSTHQSRDVSCANCHSVHVAKDKFESHRAALAQKVWRRMKATDSLECRNCHHADKMNLDLQSEKAKARHASAKTNGKTCIDCHFAIAHKEPEGPGPAEMKMD